jgi:uncharacterized membrane protein (UPF0127 family)
MQAFNVTQQKMLARVLTVADTFLRSLMGLIGKSSLPEGNGLWILPCQSVHTFWMRFPIDLIFLDRQKTVIHLVEGMKPFRVSRHFTKASSVLELPVNVIRKTTTRVGDQIEISG